MLNKNIFAQGILNKDPSIINIYKLGQSEPFRKLNAGHSQGVWRIVKVNKCIIASLGLN